MKETKFQNYREEPSNLVKMIEDLPTSTKDGTTHRLQALQKYFVEKLSKRDQDGNIINAFPVPKDANGLIEFTKDYVGKEYGESLYVDHLKDYIDGFWETVTSNFGNGAAFDLIVNPMERLAGAFGVNPNMTGKAGSEYNRITTMLKENSQGKLEAKVAGEIAEKFVNVLDLKDKTKEFLKNYLVKKREIDPTFYHIEISHELGQLVNANAEDFKDYAIDIGTKVWETGTGTEYDKFTGLTQTTIGMENDYAGYLKQSQQARA